MKKISQRIKSVCIEVGLSPKASAAVALLVVGYLRKERRHYTRKDDAIDRRMDAMLMQRFNWAAPVSEWSWLPSNKALAMLGVEKQTRADQMIFSATMARLGATRHRRSNGMNLRLTPPLA